jgi:hypothetical protein
MSEENWESVGGGAMRREVPGGWIYSCDWQYDLGDGVPSLHGVNHVFVPAPIETRAALLPADAVERVAKLLGCDCATRVQCGICGTSPDARAVLAALGGA